MIRRPPRSTRTDTLFPYTTLFRSEPDALIDLSQIDFDALAASFAGRKRAETDRLAALLKQRAISAAGRNPTRYDLVERIEELIATYNAGSLNIDEYLKRLIELSQSLSEEEQRTVVGGLTEEELARTEERRGGKECVSTCRSRW